MWCFKRKKRPVEEWPADRPLPESLQRAIEASRDFPPTLKEGDVITGEEMRRDMACLMMCKPFTEPGIHRCGR